jgi:hypothetical protein
MALTSRLSKLKEAADKKKAGKSKAEGSAPQREKPASAPIKPAAAEEPDSIAEPERAPEKAPQPNPVVAPPPIQTQPPSLNVLIMSDERIPLLPDKLEVFRSVLKRYDEIEKGKDAQAIVDEEIKAFLAKKK